MNDDLDARLRDWMAERGRTTDADAAALSDRVATLPDRPGRWRPLAIAAGVVLLIGFSVAVLPRVGTIGSRPQPPDPPAFAGDPRMDVCGVDQAPALYALELRRARDFWLHFPAAGRAPELEVDEPAFVVVYEGEQPFPVFGFPGAGAEPTNSPGQRDVCVLVAGGPMPERHVYAGVPLVGFTARVDPPPEASHTLTGTPAPTFRPGLPEWAANLLGALECEGPAQTTGHERATRRPVGQTGTASPYPWIYAVDDVDLPVEGWREDPKTSWENGQSRYVRFVNEADGRVKAVILMEGSSSDGGPGRWAITGFRACPPAEFDPLLGRTTDDAPWVDGRGAHSNRVRTTPGPAHCGWQSSVLLRFDSELYLRDPLGLFADHTEGSFEPAAELPADAVDTGLRSARWELFNSSDASAVWVRVDGDHVERWPRSREPFIGCV